MKEELYYVVDSLGVAQPEIMEVPGWSLTQTFVEVEGPQVGERNWPGRPCLCHFLDS